MIENEIINKAIKYIFDHIDEKLTLDEVAEYCHMSKYHFSRLFKQEVGESVYFFIKHNRMALSAVQLKANQGRSVTDVGLEIGYSASNYATAFKEQFKVSPVQFRQERTWNDGIIPHPFFHQKIGYLKTFEEYDKDITIRELPERTMRYRRFIGSYAELKEHWICFMNDNERFVTEDTIWIERTFSDPDIMEIDRCICDIGMVVTNQIESQIKEQELTSLSGGKYAAYRFAGHKKEIYTLYQGLFTVWLPQSKYELGCGEVFDMIYKFHDETDTLEMEICVPVM